MADDPSTSGADGNEPAEPNETVDQETEGSNGSADQEPRRVSHDTYKKTVNEAKAMRARARELEAKLKSIEDERLEAAGQKDELIKSLRGKLDAETKRTKETINSFARKSLSAQLKNAALEAGCIDPDAVMSLADLSEVEVSSDTFEANGDDVKSVINGLKKSKPYLFKKAAPNVNARLPGGERVSQSPVDFNSMSTEQIQAWLRENYNK